MSPLATLCAALTAVYAYLCAYYSLLYARRRAEREYLAFGLLSGAMAVYALGACLYADAASLRKAVHAPSCSCSGMLTAAALFVDFAHHISAKAAQRMPRLAYGMSFAGEPRQRRGPAGARQCERPMRALHAGALDARPFMPELTALGAAFAQRLAVLPRLRHHGDHARERAATPTRASCWPARVLLLITARARPGAAAAARALGLPARAQLPAVRADGELRAAGALRAHGQRAHQPHARAAPQLQRAARRPGAAAAQGAAGHDGRAVGRDRPRGAQSAGHHQERGQRAAPPHAARQRPTGAAQDPRRGGRPAQSPGGRPAGLRATGHAAAPDRAGGGPGARRGGAGAGGPAARRPGHVRGRA